MGETYKYGVNIGSFLLYMASIGLYGGDNAKYTIVTFDLFPRRPYCVRRVLPTE